jgi:2-phospho-L-lactate guanylyltransferase
MLEDVLDALSATRELSGIIVVTQDPEAAAIARHTGCIALADPADAGINPAIEIATRFLADQADAGMIVVPSDIPHLSPGVVADVIARVSRSPSVVAVPAKDGGTNMLACRPVQIIQSGFGPDSFQHHRRLAQDAGVVFDAFPHHETAHDIDRPEDLATFLSFASATRTHAFLDTLNIDAPNIATRLHSALESVAPV